MTESILNCIQDSFKGSGNVQLHSIFAFPNPIKKNDYSITQNFGPLPPTRSHELFFPRFSNTFEIK